MLKHKDKTLDEETEFKSPYPMPKGYENDLVAVNLDEQQSETLKWDFFCLATSTHHIFWNQQAKVWREKDIQVVIWTTIRRSNSQQALPFLHGTASKILKAKSWKNILWTETNCKWKFKILIANI